MDKRTAFLALSGVFVALMVYFSIDILTKTTPPWQRKKETNKLIDIPDTTRTDFADTTIIVYKVKKNEALSSIADKFNMKIETVKQLNELATDNLRENQSLLLQVRAIHEVQPNEFLEKISRLYTLEMKMIMRANGITKADQIRKNQKLYIPIGKKK